MVEVIIATWRKEDLRPTPKQPSGLLTAHSVKRTRGGGGVQHGVWTQLQSFFIIRESAKIVKGPMCLM